MLFPCSSENCVPCNKENMKTNVNINDIFSLVSCVCETSSLTLRESYILWMFESRILNRRFRLKRVEVTGCWRKFLNEELLNLLTEYYSEGGRHEKFVSKILVDNPERTRALGRHNHRSEDDVKWIFMKLDGLNADLIFCLRAGVVCGPVLKR